MRLRYVLPFVFFFSCSDAAPDEEVLVIIGDSEKGFIDPTTGEPVTEPNEPKILEFASVGTRCNNGQVKEFVVLSDGPVSCEQHAEAIDAKLNGVGFEGVVVLNRDELKGDHEYCDGEEACDNLALDVELDDDKGSWTAIIDGKQTTQNFLVDPCSYDSALAPLNGDTPASEISITEVALYQAVKIPLIQNNEPVAPNAPIIAGRPGVLRVFISPTSDFQSRNLKVRFTLGDVVEEQQFMPSGVSDEREGRSTINFAIEPGDIKDGSDFSIEILENETCGSAQGGTYTYRAPAEGKQAIPVRTLNKPLNVVLVPVRYNADGSGRFVDFNETELQRYRDIMMNFYPVHEVNVTAIPPVDYPNAIQPNGAGFGEFLNWCLNFRFNDTQERDTYYYCLASPAPSYGQFCGRGCVAGIATVPRATDWTSRGGVGIAYRGAGEGTFVHEIGHALGRPHSPCGGAQGVDPSYPHNGGTIGVWGYSVTGGQLVDPNSKDFMGYCEPSWVSDWTYSAIYARLQAVLNDQLFEVPTPETRYRTAVLDIDGKLKMGGDRVMTTLPTGTKIDALWSNANESADVWVTPIADIDAALITFKDPGFSGAEIELPGLGIFQIDQ